MGLDTKYRPVAFDDVVGQGPTVRILRHYITTKSGFHQSYLFAGHHGSGKTTLARILARALLCKEPTPKGDPCDKCFSCTSLLTKGGVEGFTEVDAATNSGKDDVKRILEEIEYSTYSGNRRLYLIDESHAMSSQGLDALLKALEEPLPDSEDKRLVCIFCTTEPEKMKETLASRCAPVFRIKPAAPSLIADRLAWVCDQEGISYDKGVLRLIAEYTESHIRDALKAVEAVSLLGPVDSENVGSYLGLGRNDKFLDILDFMDQDSTKALQIATSLLDEVSPGTVYAKLTEAAMFAFRAHIGAGEANSFWSKDRLTEIGTRVGSKLLDYVERFSSRPSRPSPAMVLCDIAYAGTYTRPSVAQAALPRPSMRPAELKVEGSGISKHQNGGVVVNPRAVNVAPTQRAAPTTPGKSGFSAKGDVCTPQFFVECIRGFLLEKEQDGRQTGSTNVGGV
jgi:DNA polymerase III subunit gamma/tau